MSVHVPVMLEETLVALNPVVGGCYIDATLGGAGHAQALLEAISPDGRVLGIDADPQAVWQAEARLGPIYQDRFVAVVGHNDQVQRLAAAHGFMEAHGILFDLGLSSDQLADHERGFAFSGDGSLDMRFNPTVGQPAYQLLAELSADELAALLFRYGEEPHARQIARRIVQARRQQPITRTGELVDVITAVVQRRPGASHPATRTFQALRIAVNRELELLEGTLIQAIGCLAARGRLAVITFHSLEDRIVKNLFRRESTGCICPPRLPECRCGHQAQVWLVTKKALMPNAAEVDRNPRSRSAKLRVIEKLEAKQEGEAQAKDV